MLDVRQLQALATVIEFGSFGAAGQALSLSLSAVSLRIKALEETLGQRLLVRGKPVRPTAAGQALVAHVKLLRLMEADLLDGLAGGAGLKSKPRWQTLSVAINADSAASWFLPGVAAPLKKHRLLLDIVLDDQDHTHDLLKSGDVVACVSTLAQPMRGCLAEPLGVMRYRCMAAPELAQRCRTAQGTLSPHKLLAQPAVIFNRKDALQDLFLAQQFGLTQARYPRHFAPAIDAFETAVELGLGWGMVPELHMARHPGLVDLMPGATVAVTLYWQHWAQEAPSAQRLTQAVRSAAGGMLLPVVPTPPVQVGQAA